MGCQSGLVEATWSDTEPMSSRLPRTLSIQHTAGVWKTSTLEPILLPTIYDFGRLARYPQRAQAPSGVRSDSDDHLPDCCVYQVTSHKSRCQAPSDMHHRHCEQNNGIYPGPDDAYTLGLCTGSLAVAAVSSCHSLRELLIVGVHTVRIAFATGMCAFEVGRRIEQSDNYPRRSWSMAVVGMNTESADQAVKGFAKVEVSIPQRHARY